MTTAYQKKEAETRLRDGASDESDLVCFYSSRHRPWSRGILERPSWSFYTSGELFRVLKDFNPICTRQTITTTILGNCYEFPNYFSFVWTWWRLSRVSKLLYTYADMKWIAFTCALVLSRRIHRNVCLCARQWESWRSNTLRWSYKSVRRIGERTSCGRATVEIERNCVTLIAASARSEYIEESQVVHNENVH